jgi:hypothetical protein
MSRLAQIFVGTTLLAALTACGLIGGRPAERDVTIDLPVSRSAAVRHVTAAFRDQGYVIRNTLTSGTKPETEPFRQGDAEAVFRAEITGSGSTSRVVLSGTYQTKLFCGFVKSGEQEVRNSDDPTERALWNRLQQLRLAIREDAGIR